MIENDPSCLGLGELDVRATELQQPYGQLDLLLADPDTATRYTVELQLGATDPDHIIRTLEYWDIERRRWPRYEHIAVIVAEDITARFFNVIALFNGVLPLVAIKVTALDTGPDECALVFTKVLDHTPLGTDEDDQPQKTTTRADWQESRPETVTLADRIHDMVQQQDPGAELNYTRFYIGLLRAGLPNNYTFMKPQKAKVILGFKIPPLRRRDQATRATRHRHHALRP